MDPNLTYSLKQAIFTFLLIQFSYLVVNNKFVNQSDA